MKDIAAVEWLPLAAAVRRLSYPLEKLFLRNVGRRALKRRKRGARRKAAKTKPRGRQRTPQEPKSRVAQDPHATAHQRRTPTTCCSACWDGCGAEATFSATSRCRNCALNLAEI